MNTRPLGLKARLQSFRYAAKGIACMVRTQPNAWIHALATAGVLGVGALLGISTLEWIALILACVAVWVAEAVNTSLEFLADATTREFSPDIGKAKDVAAGAVLMAAIGATAVGILVFFPHVAAMLR